MEVLGHINQCMDCHQPVVCFSQIKLLLGLNTVGLIIIDVKYDIEYQYTIILFIMNVKMNKILINQWNNRSIISLKSHN